MQAAIAAVELAAPDADAIDWAQIAERYGALAALNPSPVIELNRFYLRDGDRVFETYWTNGRGVEAMARPMACWT